ncbi:MAG: hypothetical protein R3D30_12795 [Hyphomicrobiales bacterium]
MVSLSDIQGLWRRRLLAWQDREPDTTTEVFWLQGPETFADLRIPMGRPPCSASCLRELDWPTLRFLARQEGFFGTLKVGASVGHWHRVFDYQPDTGRQDRGYLTFEGEVLIELGAEAPYAEHWIRQRHTDDVAALTLAEAPDRIGCLIVSGDVFMYARSRGAPLPPGADLTECLETAGSLREAQALFDCEIAFGRVQDHQWRIERSTLPFREGHSLRPNIDGETSRLRLDDLTPSGEFVRRAWQIMSSQGATAKRQLFPVPMPASSASLSQTDNDLTPTKSGVVS